MALTGRQKAALLLMSLDEMAAAELLKGLDTEGIQSITMEIAQLGASKQSNSKHREEVAQEFYQSLQENNPQESQEFDTDRFLNEMLAKKIVSKDEAEDMQAKIKKSNARKELFAEILSAKSSDLVIALKDAHPQTLSVILSELDSKKSQEVMSLLEEDARLKAICKMTYPETLSPSVINRIAIMVSEKLRDLKNTDDDVIEVPEENREDSLRKIAVVLNGLEKDMRDKMLTEVGKKDKETGDLVKRLMVTWEDILIIADRSLQEALRNIDAGKLAVALYEAEPEIVAKIRDNISERAGGMLDEEISLMQEPEEQDILDAREEVVNPLRDANEEGTLKMTG